MSFDIKDFKEVAQRNWFNNDIVLNTDRTKITSQFFHSKSTVGSASRATNEATMEAFREALVERYGVSGEEAFKAVLGERADRGQSLRKNDVLKAINLAHTPAERAWNAFHNVAHSMITTMMEGNPFLKSLPEETKKFLRYEAIGWMRQELNLRYDAVTAEREYADKLDELGLKMERVIWDAVDGDPAIGRKVSDYSAKPGPGIPETGKGKAWTDGDTEALMLDMHNPETRERMSLAFLQCVNAARSERGDDPMVKAWNEAHENGHWKSEEAFISFARTYADRLPYGLTIAANSVIEKVLKDPNSALYQEAMESLPDLKLDIEEWHIESDETLEDLELNFREDQYRMEIFRDQAVARGLVAKCDALLAEAKAAVSVCEGRGDIEEMNTAERTYAKLEKELGQLRQEALSASIFGKNAPAKDYIAYNVNLDVTKLEAKFKALSESYHRDVHVDPKTDFKGEDRLTWLKHQIAVTQAETTAAYVAVKAENEQHLVVLQNAKDISGLINRQVYPTRVDPDTKKIVSYDKEARNDAIAKRIADSFKANVENLEKLAGDISYVERDLRELDTHVTQLAQRAQEEALSEEALSETLKQAEELKKTLEAKGAERKEEFAERAKLMSLDSAMSNSPMLLGIKTRYTMIIRQAILDFAKADGGNTAEGRVLSRFA